MPGHVRPEMFGKPIRRPVELAFVIILARNQERSYFQPYLGLPMQVLECVQHRGERPKAQLAIKLFGETFQIHVGRVHHGAEPMLQFPR